MFLLLDRTDSQPCAAYILVMMMIISSVACKYVQARLEDGVLYVNQSISKNAQLQQKVDILLMSLSIMLRKGSVV